MSTSISSHRVASLVGDFTREPAYAGLAEALQLLIGDGRIGVDVRLPSERDLTQALGVSRTTVTRAYAQLRDAGYAEARRGSGTRTRVPGGRARAHDRALMPASDTGAIDLVVTAPTAPPQTAAAYAAAMAELPAYLSGIGYFPLGVDRLREVIAQGYTDRGLTTTPDQVMVTSGALSATTLVTRALSRRGDRVLIESPTYPNAASAMRGHGVRLVPAQVDADGWDMASFAATLHQSNPRLAYLVPDFHNPTGNLMDDEQRQELASHLRRSGTLAVVDETTRGVVLDQTLESAMPGHFAAHEPGAVTVSGISKSHWGGLRIGWVRAPLPLMSRLLDARIALDLGAPVLEQLAAAHLLAAGDAGTAESRERTRHQRDTLVAALGEHLGAWRVRVPRGGLALWCELPSPSATALAEAVRRHDVLLTPGPVFSVEGGLDRWVRLPYAKGPEVLTEAVQRLRLAWQEVEERTRPGTAEALPSRVLIG